MLSIGVPLSLSGRYARFGGQAARGLDAWRSLTDGVELVVEDDQSDPKMVERVLRDLAGRCDLLLGPYSAGLARRAGRVAVEQGLLLWNHGGSGGPAFPGHVVPVLTPASRYAEPFVRHLVRGGDSRPLWIVQGTGRFAREVALGAERRARIAGLPVTRQRPRDPSWHLFSAGSFDEDVTTVTHTEVPGAVCAVAAGVRAFGESVPDPRGVYGVGQWFPGSGAEAAIGCAEPDFIAAYGGPPDYPAVQAAAAAILAVHCAELAGGTAPDDLWRAAAALRTTTLYGAFALNPGTGVQTGHRTVLTRWEPGGPVSYE
ncbi:ABC transporter substrate-binding protein [Nonomuraea sp. NPDC049419]|uniref:ABC transporter substrate-binding protein n=1 Tax=Nonomuraea sp. NPDC049419 TaxID=3155772 RepID=UPI00342309D0